MNKKALGFKVLGVAAAGMLAACGGPADPDAAKPDEVAAFGARVTAAESGQALMVSAKAAPPALVREFIAARGAGRAADELRVTGAARGRGLTHVRMEQEVAGLRVHGAYVKAAVTDAGELVHVVDRLARSERGVAPAGVDAAAALGAVLARLGYDAAARGAVSGVSGNVTRFARGATFHRDPTVERVAYVDGAGALREGFLVETWSQRGNRLDHTLVGGSGEVISIEHRTNTDRYNVFVEDPLKGSQTVVSGPGAGSAESPAGWLGAGAQTTVNISGNNAHAYLDADANNAADPGGAAVANGDFLTAVDLAAQPSTPGNQAVAVQNLFYLNNVVHDTLYRHGFDEAAGNFQASNFGNGGAGNDPVNAEAQDGSGTDNANFATPSDGSSPRMQMYLWSGRDPDGLVTAGGVDRGAYGATFGPALTLAGTSGALALYDDGTGVTSDGCEKAAKGALSGKIAIVDRGTCNFTVKVLNAQNAGAVAVIVANNVDGPAFAMGGTERRIKIPSGMVTLADGDALRAQLGAGATLRKNPVPPLMIDGDLDADIVFHEYGHGLTWRMIGGMSGPLAGAIGEGASDAVAFLLDGDDRIGEYAWGDAAGIRRQPYAAYQGSYADVDGGEVHNDGEIYAAAMYRVWQNYLAAGLTTDDLLDDFVDGMNFTPSTPAYEDMRDGMLQSVGGSGRECLIWEGFAHFGVGVGARGQVSRRGTVTITESFALPSSCP